MNPARGPAKPRILVLSRSFPNSVMDMLGLWVESLVRRSPEFCDIRVISPVPYCPPLPFLPANLRRFRNVEKQATRGGVKVYYPRFVLGPGYSLFEHESWLYYRAVRALVHRLAREWPFDLIHAHFTYPDGVAAVRLGRELGVPAVITEHVPWDVWDRYPRVRQRASEAAIAAACHVSVSRSALRTVEQYTGPQPNQTIIPNGVDGSVFTADRQPGEMRQPDQILFAGAIRPVKGADLLLRAVRMLRDRGRDVRLVFVGEAFYRQYEAEENRIRALTTELGMNDRVTFAGKKAPVDLAACMRQSAVLVLPSRAESFGMVLVEALACGTPVVATRCGGPEDIVTPEVGILVAHEDPAALAAGIEHVLDRRNSYDPARLRRYALENFGIDKIAARFAEVYAEACAGYRDGTRTTQSRAAV